MKTMKKVLSLALVAVMVLGLLAACNPSNPNTTTKISTLEEEKGANLKILIPGYNQQDPTDWRTIAINKFKAEYPDVTVSVVSCNWNDWSEKLMNEYHSGDPVDVINDGVNNNPKFPMEGITQPVQPYINMQNPNLHLATMDSCFKYQGNYYVAASESNFGIIYYNKDLFQAAGIEDPLVTYNKGGWTWNYFQRIAKQLTNKDEKKWGFATEFPYLFYGANATSTLKITDDGKFALNMDDPAFVAALEFIQDSTYNDGWSGWEGDAMTTFQTGNAAMIGSWTMYESGIDALHNIDPVAFPKMNYGAVPLPAGPNNPDKLNVVHAAGWAIGAGSDCPAHAGKLIDILVDAHAAQQELDNAKKPQAHVELYARMRDMKGICINTRDSAIGGGYGLAGDVAAGTAVSQAIEQYKPEYQRTIDEVNKNVK